MVQHRGREDDAARICKDETDLLLRHVKDSMPPVLHRPIPLEDLWDCVDYLVQMEFVGIKEVAKDQSDDDGGKCGKGDAITMSAVFVAASISLRRARK